MRQSYRNEAYRIRDLEEAEMDLRGGRRSGVKCSPSKNVARFNRA